MSESDYAEGFWEGQLRDWKKAREKRLTLYYHLVPLYILAIWNIKYEINFEILKENIKENNMLQSKLGII